MTDKEQLKKIKEKYLENEKFWYDTYKEQVKLSREQIKKLQERVQELEKTVEDYKTVNKELHQRGRKVRKQNKRYREALEFYADEENYIPFYGIFLSSYQNKVDEDGGKKARQALGGWGMNRKETLTLIEDRDYWKKLYKEISDKNTQLEKAPKWDGHKPSDITRLLTLVGEKNG